MKTGRSLVWLWLTGLLGGFELEQMGGFYKVAGVRVEALASL
jgi:hypothetical protein